MNFQNLAVHLHASCIDKLKLSARLFDHMIKQKIKHWSAKKAKEHMEQIILNINNITSL